ncbi:hypothetical protein AQI95_13180 [Streptomyces yokosukanensis]|uniref:Uncharacterized protein n=1 Tax=Streptomyces yokosukanensis TaxID=67386 RepID=A0A101P6P7_9ACTN|nr:hypothetical protein [Streptomyces yokosukanensis]KUN05897.1 hypothetical protein AQI95_13180 [Streptomyces yokosukanensis]
MAAHVVAGDTEPLAAAEAPPADRVLPRRLTTRGPRLHGAIAQLPHAAGIRPAPHLSDRATRPAARSGASPGAC